MEQSPAGPDPVELLELELISGPIERRAGLERDVATGPVPVEHLRAAVFTALAARHLLHPGVVTAAVLGSGPTAAVQLAVLADYIRDVSHVAVCPGPAAGADLDPALLDLLRSRGISITVTEDVADAVFGANLVIVAADLGDLDPRTLVRGAVLVNAGRSPLTQVAAAARRIVVDDRPLAGRLDAEVRARVATWTGSRHRAFERVVDLRQVLTGECVGRTTPDELVLVELLGGPALDRTFHSLVHRVASRREHDVSQNTERGES